MVYVPAESTEPVDDQVTLQLRGLADRRVALVVYTALDRLIAGCGEAQPWAMLAAESLSEMRPDAGWDVVLVDPELPPDLRQDHTDEPDSADGEQE